MKVKIKDKVTSDGKRFAKELKDFKKLQVRIGFQQGEASGENGVDMVDIAMFNELGTINAPSRPFMRKSVDENAETINAFLKSIMKKFSKGEITAREALEKIGAMQKGLMQDKIDTGDFVENAKSTIRRKKSDTPLIDTGRMRQSVNYVIKPKGGD